VNKSCPLSCSNHGYCNAASGKCDCDYGYHGTGCSSLRCFHGSLFYKAGDGANATMVDVEDGVAPANSQQTCVCESGWEGHHCNTTVTKGERLSAVVDTVLNASHQHSVATRQLAAESEEDEQKAKLRQDDSSGVN